MSKLFDSFQLADLTLKNRIALAPMTRARAGTERVPNALMAEYYSQRAGAGLILTEATVVSEQGIGWVGTPGIYNDAQQEGWKQVIEAAHAQGSKIFLQLWFCGRASHSSYFNGELPVAPSAIKNGGEYAHTPNGKESYETPRALETEEIPGIIAQYGEAARRAKEAGFDGIQVHAANGYLIDQFLQTRTNQRDDQYGGSLENRYRFLDETLDAVFAHWPSKRVSVRISPNGVFNDMGSDDFRETFLFVAEQLNKRDLCFLEVLDGLAFGFHEKGEAMTLNEFRNVYTGTLMANCGYTKEMANEAIDSGSADLVSIGRPFISNPDLVERFQNNWPLAEDAPVTVWNGPDAEGYTDFPTYSA